MQGFIYPDDVGAPIGEAGGPRVMLLEMHYDNPLKKTGAACNIYCTGECITNAVETTSFSGNI